ncbi:hypothetical protein ACFL35_12655 [Candidatus Riflebacteria bacterium]
MSDFITLTCPSCNGKLEITPDVERFSCGYCGNEHIVKRGGGIVRLEAVTQAIQEVKTEVKGVKEGMDKAVAELATKRLKEEITELKWEIDKLGPRPELTSLGKFIFGCSFLIVVFLFLIFSYFFLTFILAGVLGSKPFWLFNKIFPPKPFWVADGILEFLLIFLILTFLSPIPMYIVFSGARKRETRAKYDEKIKPLEKALKEKEGQLKESLRIANS